MWVIFHYGELIKYNKCSKIYIPGWDDSLREDISSPTPKKLYEISKGKKAQESIIDKVKNAVSK